MMLRTQETLDGEIIIDSFAGGLSGSIHTVDGLLKNHVQEDYA